MSKADTTQKQISQLTNEIELFRLYLKVEDQQFRMFILSRLKQVLLQTPNNIYVATTYLFDTNWTYMDFLFYSLKRNDINKRQIAPQLKLLYHVVSLRIKFWYTEKDLQQFFLKTLKFLEEQQRSAFLCLDFFVQLIDTFQNQDVRDEIDIQANKKISHYRMTRCTTSFFDSLNLKTKKSFDYRDSRRLLKQNIYQRNDKQVDSKVQPKINRKVQAYILNKGLNKMITIANTFFNRVVVENKDYQFQEDSVPYFVKVSHQKITKVLNLLHKSFTYDFCATQKSDQTDQYTADRSPIILPTKFSKYSNFGQFQRWLKNLDNVEVYRYLFDLTAYKPLKLTIVNILGDMLRIHMKYFKTKNNYKTHLESIVTPLTNILEKTQLQGEDNYQLAMVIGSNIQKLLAPSTIGVFIALSESYISNFIQALDICIKSYILYRDKLDPYLIKYYIGFFVDFYSKISFQKNLPKDNRYLKSDVQRYINGIGQNYQKRLLIQSPNQEDFDLYFQIFKIYKPKANTKQYNNEDLCDQQLIRIQMINFASKFIHSLWHYQQIVKCRLKRALQKYEQYDEEKTIKEISQSMFNFTSSIQNFLINDAHIQKDTKIKGIIIQTEYLNYVLEKLINEQSRIDYFQVFSEYFNIYSFVEVVLKLSFKSFELISILQIDLNEKKPNYYSTKISYLNNNLLHLLYIFMKKNLQKYKKCQNDTTIQRNTLQRRSSMNWSKIQLKQDKYEVFLQDQCEYLRTLLKSTSQMFKILFLNLQKSDQENQLQENLKQNKELNYLNLKSRYAIMRQLENQTILESINLIQKIYYVVVEQMDLHRMHHVNHVKKMQKQENSQSMQYDSAFQIQLLESKQHFIDQNAKIDCYCVKNIHQFDLSQYLSCFNILSYFQMLNQNDLIKRTHENQCQTQTKTDHQQESLFRKLNSVKKPQVSPMNNYREIYSLNKMISNLFFQMRRQSCKGLLDIKKIKLLETIKILLRLFRMKKHDSQIKMQIINQCHLFLIQQIKLVNFEHLKDQNNNNTQQFTKIITLILECSHSILTHMLTSEIYSNKINLLNQELILIFNSQNQSQKQRQNIYIVKQIDLSQTNSKFDQQEENCQTRSLNKNQAQMFSKMNPRLANFLSYVIELIIYFPNDLIQYQGFNQTRQALSSMLVQIYYQFSAFKNIFLIQNPLQFELSENLYNSVDKIEKATQEDQYSYFLKVDQSNIRVVLGSFNIFIKFVNKLIQFSIFLPNKLISLSKYNEFFLDQINQFIQNYFKFTKQIKNQNQKQKLQIQYQRNTKQSSQSISMKQIFLHKIQQTFNQLLISQIDFLIKFFERFETQKLNLIKINNKIIKSISKGLDLYRKNMIRSYELQNKLQSLRNLIIFPKIKEFSKEKMVEQNFPKNRRYYNAEQYIYHISSYEDCQNLIDQIQDYQKYYQFYIAYKQQDYSSVNSQQSEGILHSEIKKNQMEKQIQEHSMQTTIYEEQSFNKDDNKIYNETRQLEVEVQTQQIKTNENYESYLKQKASNNYVQRQIQNQKTSFQQQLDSYQFNKNRQYIKKTAQKINLSPQRYGYIMNVLNLYTNDQKVDQNKNQHQMDKNISNLPEQECHQQIVNHKIEDDDVFNQSSKLQYFQQCQNQRNQKIFSCQNLMKTYNQEIQNFNYQDSLIDLTQQDQDDQAHPQPNGQHNRQLIIEIEDDQAPVESQDEDYDDIPKLSQIKQTEQFSSNQKDSL